MNQLKKGIILGLGLHEMNNKHVHEFTHELYRKGHISHEESKELADHILTKAKDHNRSLENKVEQLVRNVLKREEIATTEHINYLEKRIELLEEEIDHLLLEKEIESMSDEEIEDLLKELGIDVEESESEDNEDCDVNDKECYPNYLDSEAEDDDSEEEHYHGKRVSLDDDEESDFYDGESVEDLDDSDLDESFIEDLLAMDEKELEELLREEELSVKNAKSPLKVKVTEPKKKAPSKKAPKKAKKAKKGRK